MQPLKRLILALAVTPLLLSCGSSGKSVEITVRDLSGSWSDSQAGTLVFAEDRTLTASRLRIKTDLIPRCPTGTAKGGWGFMKSDGSGGDYTQSQTAKSGSALGVWFNGVALDNPCSSLELDIRERDNHLVLCVTDDPDEPCEPGIYFVKEK